MIGRRIKQARQALNLNMRDFASLTGIAQSTLSGIENEKNIPSARVLINLVQNTNISPSWLLTGEGEIFFRSGTNKDIDMEHLTQIIIGVENYLNIKKLPLSAANIATIALKIYLNCDKALSDKDVKDLLNRSLKFQADLIIGDGLA